MAYQVFQVVQDNRTGDLYLDQVGARLAGWEHEMARASDKTVLKKLYPGAQDMTGDSPKGKE